MPFTKGELGYFNSHVVVTPPIDEFFASHAALAFFLVSVIVEEAEADELPLVVVHTQVRSFLQAVTQNANKIADANNNFFIANVLIG